ncbi:MAG: hypothetical protein MZW92_25250 [Comamonadaceae bacterium]|nr:hypothetical protein [Comamonadaceae bacterium]
MGVKMQPEDAFGEYDAELVRIEPLSVFPDDIQIGMQFERVTDDGEEEMLYTITDIADGKVVVDGNHPLAGTAVVFQCEVTDVRRRVSGRDYPRPCACPGAHHHH